MPSEAAENNVKPGDILGGKYVIRRVIGRGGMGVVVEATHIDLKEQVAIKVLHQRYLGNQEALRRFHQEARAASRIRGEHSVRLMDKGTTATGAPFLVMELLEGSDLTKIVRAGPLPVDEAVLYILQACEGMAEVHFHGIIHRDLKPGNLFVTRRLDGTPLVKVLDFGIAKSDAPQDEADRWITMDLVALGTPLYMSPEQLRSSKDVDARADIWSLGAILYELIAGKAAFGGSTVTNITARVLESQPMSLSEVRPDAPKELERVIGRALAKRPEQRFPDVAVFAEALAPFAGEAGAQHAARAGRILHGEGRGFGAGRFSSSASLPDLSEEAETQLQLQTELGTTLAFVPNRRRRWRLGVIAGVSLALLGGIMALGAAEEEPPLLTAVKGLKAQSDTRSVVVSAAARRAEELAASVVPPAPSASASARPPKTGQGRGTPAPNKPGRELIDPLGSRR